MKKAIAALIILAAAASAHASGSLLHGEYGPSRSPMGSNSDWKRYEDAQRQAAAIQRQQEQQRQIQVHQRQIQEQQRQIDQINRNQNRYKPYGSNY